MRIALADQAKVFRGEVYPPGTGTAKSSLTCTQTVTSCWESVFIRVLAGIDNN